MRGRARADGPNARIKFTRDWEYPWTFLRARASPGARILDCGAGNSPLPFLWARRGSMVSALDRDAVIASTSRYLVWCVEQLVRDLVMDARKSAGRLNPPERSSNEARRSGPRATVAQRPAAGRLQRFVKYHVRQNRYRLSRVVKPDVWGPVSPALLRKYGVTYVRADLTKIPFPAETFDVVTCVSVLEHMPPPARTSGLTEMARVLRPGGRLILTYDLIDGDISDSLAVASGCSPTEAVYFHAAKSLYSKSGSDVVGLVLEK